MIDENIIASRLAKIREYSNLLKELMKVSKEDFVNTPAHYLGAERILEVMIQSMIDIGTHIVAALLLRKAEDYHQVFDILSAEGIISKEFLPRVHGMVGLRNLLSHEYLTIDHGKLYDNIKAGLYDFGEFSALIVSFLRQKNKINKVQETGE